MKAILRIILLAIILCCFFNETGNNIALFSGYGIGVIAVGILAIVEKYLKPKHL